MTNLHIVPSMNLVQWILAVLFFVLVPTSAFAWGPGTHVEVALGVLSNLALVAPFVRGLIKRYPDAFIYGAASPDIVVGKKYVGYLHHCHNWRVGWLILHEAKTDLERAAAYGYLTHLAADIVAHNYYIPVKIMRSWKQRLLTHTYWEMRFDLGVSEEAWVRLETITNDGLTEFDDLLDRVLRRTLFSFSTNKKIFNTILKFQKMKQLRKSLAIYAKHSRFDIGEENRQHYVDLMNDAAMEFLKNPETAACLEVEPAGTDKIAYAKEMRKKIRALSLRGIVTDDQVEKFIELAKERLAVGLYRPGMKLPEMK